MRHRKNTRKLSRESSHRRCLMANMLKSLITNERIETTVAKAKVLRSFADQMITLGKKDTLASKRKAIATMMVSFNTLTDKERRAAKEGDESSFNDDRLVIKKLFTELAPRYSNRQGGYTRLIKNRNRIGDQAETCFIEYI